MIVKGRCVGWVVLCKYPVSMSFYKGRKEAEGVARRWGEWSSVGPIQVAAVVIVAKRGRKRRHDPHACNRIQRADAPVDG